MYLKSLAEARNQNVQMCRFFHYIILVSYSITTVSVVPKNYHVKK